MTRDDIIRFGEQADEIADRKIKMRGEYHPDWHQVRDEAFAALVAAHERKSWAPRPDGEGGYELHCAQCWEIAMQETEAEATRERGEEPKRHPGYIIGDHWLQAAYTRVCTGETEDEVMTDYGWQRARGEK